MLLNISPLRKHREYRYLFIDQLISVFGSMITYAGLPFQIYELTDSTIAVGIIGLIELIPLLITSFIGGLLADAIDRKKLLIIYEFFILLIIFALAINASLKLPKTSIIYCSAGIIFALNSAYRKSY